MCVTRPLRCEFIWSSLQSGLVAARDARIAHSGGPSQTRTTRLVNMNVFRLGQPRAATAEAKVARDALNLTPLF